MQFVLNPERAPCRRLPAPSHAFARRIDYRYRFVPWAPVLFTSAVTGEGVRELMEMAVHIGEVRQRRVQTSELNLVMHRALAENAPPTVGHRRLKLMYVTEAEISPPTFIFFVNDPALIHFSYRRYLENAIRDAYEFKGSPLRMRFKGRGER